MTGKEYIIQHNGRWIIDTTHALERMAERETAPMVELEDNFKKMVDRIMTLKTYHKLPYNTEFFVWFRSIQQGFIVAHRRDTKIGSKKLHFFIVTAYPKGSKIQNHKHKLITIK
jgi:hypothetical protein